MAKQTRIPQVSPWLGQEEADAAAKVVLSQWVTEGPKSEEFSEKLNELIGAPYGVFAPNGTLALVLGLMALEIGQGDEVLVPNTTFIASANAVTMLGATPVLVDVDNATFQIDTIKAESLVNERTRAIMPVHLYGTACNMHAVQSFATKHKLKIIEDAAQGIGVYYHNQHVGSIGDIGCFSFFADKTLTTGEGGYVVCRDKAFHEKLLLLRNQGRFDRGSFIHPMIGYNFRITDIQAAIGLVQLSKLEEIITKKKEVFQRYEQRLKAVPGLRILQAEVGSTHVPFRCVLIVKRAHELMRYLAEHSIQSRSFFYPLNKQPCIIERAKLGLYPYSLDDENFAHSIYGYENGLCLPNFPQLAHDQIDFICDKIYDFFTSNDKCDL